MRLKEPQKLIEIWKHALGNHANVILMRHAPKSGSDESDLSEEGRMLAYQYHSVLKELRNGWLSDPLLLHTSKSRTVATLKLLFPGLEYNLAHPDLEVNRVTPYVQQQCNELHAKTAHWRGYYLNHTYYFLQELGGKFDEENISTVVADRMANGIQRLLKQFSGDHLPIPFPTNGVIYCGHSPAIEAGCMQLLQMSLAQLGGFLNPLDSIHLRVGENERIDFVARTHVIVDYEDLESESYYGSHKT